MLVGCSRPNTEVLGHKKFRPPDGESLWRVILGPNTEVLGRKKFRPPDGEGGWQVVEAIGGALLPRMSAGTTFTYQQTYQAVWRQRCQIKEAWLLPAYHFHPTPS